MSRETLIKAVSFLALSIASFTIFEWDVAIAAILLTGTLLYRLQMLMRQTMPLEKYRKQLAADMVKSGLVSINKKPGQPAEQPPTPRRESKAPQPRQSQPPPDNSDFDSLTSDSLSEEDDVILAIGKAAKVTPPRAASKPSVPLAKNANPYQKAPAPKAETPSEQPHQAEATAKAPGSLFASQLESLQAEESGLSSLFAPPKANEVLTSDDMRLSPDELAEQAQATLDKAMAAYNKKDYGDALDTIKTWFDFNGREAETPAIVELLQLQAKNEALLGYDEEAVETWFRCFSHWEKNSDDQALTSGIYEVKSFLDGLGKFALSLPFLFMLQDKFRKNSQFINMDKIYDQIASIYHRQGDRKNLVGIYRNQMSIKKKLDDLEGQLNLLDLMGKVYFDMGDSTASRQCYHESIKIKTSMMENSAKTPEKKESV